VASIISSIAARMTVKVIAALRRPCSTMIALSLGAALPPSVPVRALPADE
jgi:hypothetical protein